MRRAEEILEIAEILDQAADRLAKVLERFDDIERRLGGAGAVAEVPDAEIPAPAGRLAFLVDHRVAGAAFDVDDILASPAAPDPESLVAARVRVGPFPQEDGSEADLAALAGSHPDLDLVVALPLAFFDSQIC